MMMCMTMNITNGIDGTHVDLSAQYGCAASLTTVTFPVRGAMIRARRFFRADMPSTGGIELYTLEPRSEYAAHCVDENGVRIERERTIRSWSFASEDFLRMARTTDQGAVDRLAHRLIAVAECHIPVDVELRFAAIEPY